MRRIPIVVFAFLLPAFAFATHLRGGEIIVSKINCSTFKIDLIVYVNTATSILFGDGSFDLGDGTKIITGNTPSILIDSYNNTGKVIYSVTHNYAKPGNYIISYTEPNRNSGIINIPGSVSVPLYLETQISSGIFCNSSPQFLVAPIDRACSKQIFYHDPAGFDPDGDSLSYELAIPGAGKNLPATGYTIPNDSKFYIGNNYNTSNEAGTGKPIFTIDPVTGLLTWDAPGQIGEYAVAFKVVEWRKADTGEWTRIGYVIRDMQIIVEDCHNSRPELSVPSDLCVEAGQLIDFNVIGNDPDHDNIKIEVFSEAFEFSPTPAIEVLHVNEIVPSGSGINFRWSTFCTDVRSSSYEFKFKITDQPVTGTRLVAFKTIRIKIIAPAPEINSVTVNPIAKTAKLQWSNYSCSGSIIQIWRRVAKYEYDQPTCNTGMPKFLGYVLLKELPSSISEFTDSDLSIGAQYCYRIVAKLNSSTETYSRLSKDVCLIPLAAKAPVITNISVIKTNSREGVMKIAWTKPFEIDPIQYPEPYQYAVERSNGFMGDHYSRIANGLSDTTFTDTKFNTLDSAYHYKIVLYVPALTDAPVDTSSVASSVFVTSTPSPNKIKLEWKADVPWSNSYQKHRWHYIYRGNEGLDGSFHLLDSINTDSINTNKENFHYTDIATKKNILSTNEIYYYRIETNGAYGNPGIKEPLINFSQVVPGQIPDTIPPLKPVAKITNTNCEENLASYSCELQTFSNSITWNKEDSDVDHYQIAVADSLTGEFVTIKNNLLVSTFIHSEIKKLSYCYRVKAIDKRGNESDWSDIICNDNCPYFELPNVFTPGNDDGLNDFFKSIKCPVFVKGYSLKIFDRSGTQVYSIAKSTDTSLLWDGRDNNNRELPAGVYFYYAEARFDVTDPGNSQKKLKGWVQLVR